MQLPKRGKLPHCLQAELHRVGAAGEPAHVEHLQGSADSGKRGPRSTSQQYDFKLLVQLSLLHLQRAEGGKGDDRQE